MNVLIVGAHPEPKSFNVALRDVAISHFQDSGETVVLRDLYKMQFNPVASGADFHFDEEKEYLNYALAQREAWAAETIAPDIKKEVDLLTQSDLLLFVFPLYWFSMPAILKGWIDRVFISGPLYGGRRFYDRGPMNGKKAMLVITLGGRDYMFGADAIHGEFECMIRHIQRGMLQYVGFDVYEPFIGWHVPYVDDSVRKNYLTEFKTTLENLDSRPVLERQSLANFDKVMRPVNKVFPDNKLRMEGIGN